METSAAQRSSSLRVFSAHNPWASPDFPSRSRGPQLVHAAPAVPRTSHLIELELKQLADFLAAEMRHDLHCAVALNVDWYHEQLGRDVSTVDDADMVRLLTLCACRDHLSLVTVEPINIGRPAMAEEPVPFGEHLFGLALVAALLAAFLAYWMVSPTDDELWEMNHGKPVQMQQIAVQR